MKTKRIDAYKANARDNAGKTRNAAEIAVGDYLYLVTGYGKENGLRDYPNSREHWLDVQARALYQAANRVANIAAKLLNA